MTRQNRFDVVVVGGGLAGLSASVALADAGLRVAVLEKAAFLGGRARSWRHDRTGDIVDIGPHVVASEYANFLKYLERLGTADRIAWQPKTLLTLATREKVYRFRQSALPPPLSLVPSIARIAELSIRDKWSNVRPACRALRYTERELLAIDSISALDFLESCGTTPRMIDWFWRFASMAVLNVPLELCSAASLMRVHGQMIGHRGVHFGFPRSGLSDLYVARSIDIVERAKGAVFTAADVVRTTTEAEMHVAHLSDSRKISGKHLIYATPPGELGALLPGFDGSFFEPSPYISIYLWFDENLVSERFWALPWSPERFNCDFYDLRLIRPGESRGSCVASNIIYSHRAKGLSDEELIDVTLRELALFAPGARRSTLIDADVHRIPMAVPCAHPGFESRRPSTDTRIPNVCLAGDWTQTKLPCSMESAVRSGYLSAELVLRRERRPQSIAKAERAYDGLARWLQISCKTVAARSTHRSR